MEKIAVIGCGPGSAAHLTEAARAAALGCEVLAGSPRLLDLFPEFPGEKIVLKGGYGGFLADLPRLAAAKRLGVLVSGDPGLHSLARLIIDRAGPCTVVPGISSIQYAFARLGMPWQGARIVSFHDHGRPSIPADLESLDAVVFLTDGAGGPRALAESLPEARRGHYAAWLCQNLSLPDEKLEKMTVEELRAAEAAPLNLVILVKEDRAPDGRP